MGSYSKGIELQATHINHLKILKFIKSSKCIFDIDLLEFIDNNTARIIPCDDPASIGFLLVYNENLTSVDLQLY